MRGRLTLVGVDDGRSAIPGARLIMDGLVVTGHLTGSAEDTEDAMRFAVAHGVRRRIERLPLRAADLAVEGIAAGAPRFRIVLDPTTVR